MNINPGRKDSGTIILEDSNTGVTIFLPYVPGDTYIIIVNIEKAGHSISRLRTEINE